ncbi:MAG: ABC transporter permease [Myxococcota bacterium]
MSESTPPSSGASRVTPRPSRGVSPLLEVGVATVLLFAGAAVRVTRDDVALGAIIALVGAVVLSVGVLRLSRRNAAREREEMGRLFQAPSRLRSVFRYAGPVMGVVFAVLTVVSLRMVEPAFGKFDLGQQLVRIAALVSAVVFVVYLLAESLPVLLRNLEHRTFVTFVAARMMRATKSGFLTVISVLSILGVGVSSCALCSVTSIMGGFGADLKRKILGNTAHILVDAGPAGFDEWRPVLDETRAAVAPMGGTVTPVVGGDAMASSSTNTAGVLMRGIDPETIGDVINLKQNIEIGSFAYLTDPAQLLDLPADEIIGRSRDGEPYYKGPGFRMPGLDPELEDVLPEKQVYPGMILGRELAKSLHVMVGDELTLLSPTGELGPLGIMPKARKFRVAAIFYSGMYEYDASHAYVMLADAQAFFDLRSSLSRIDVRIPEPERVGEVRPALDAAVAALNGQRPERPGYQPLRVRDWKEMNKNLFSALKLERIATFIILSIAIAVASFCIICTLLLMVTEKQKEIAMLKALGASDRAIMRTFVLEGVLIGGIGTVMGVTVALAACLGLSWAGVRLDPDVYYIDRLPVNVDPVDYSLVALAAMVICTLSTIYPALTASRVRPIDGLRYE